MPAALSRQRFGSGVGLGAEGRLGGVTVLASPSRSRRQVSVGIIPLATVRLASLGARRCAVCC